MVFSLFDCSCADISVWRNLAHTFRCFLKNEAHIRKRIRGHTFVAILSREAGYAPIIEQSDRFRRSRRNPRRRTRRDLRGGDRASSSRGSQHERAHDFRPDRAAIGRSATQSPADTRIGRTRAARVRARRPGPSVVAQRLPCRSLYPAPRRAHPHPRQLRCPRSGTRCHRGVAASSMR